MSFKKNLIANYASQIYMSLAALLIVPLYMKYMGTEAYGLIGFFATLQVCFNMLDLGLNPSVARETARMRAGTLAHQDYRELVRALQIIFFIVMMIGMGALLLMSHYISHSWLKVQTLPLEQVQTAIQLMVVSVALRWMSSLYRAILGGSEQFVWLSLFNWTFTTLRYAGILLVFIYVGTTPILFFLYQLVISALEFAFLAYKTIKNLPPVPKKTLNFSFMRFLKPIQAIIPFAVSVAISAAVWVVITQADKLILSYLLPLTEYGYFSLGVLAASGVMLFSVPCSMVLMPRMAKLKAEQNVQGLFSIYRLATRFVATLAIPACLILALFPEQILWIWTNNRVAAQETAPILRLYALGNAALSFSMFPYYLQYAYGTMRLHLIGNSVFATLLIPAIIWSTLHYGVAGAAWVWFSANISFFLIWTAVVHLYLAPQLHGRWLFMDIAPILCLSLLIAITAQHYWPLAHDKINQLLQLIGISALMFAVNIGFILFPTRIKQFLYKPGSGRKAESLI